MKIEVFGDGGCRERIRDSARRLRVLRKVFGEVPELILESPEVPLELLGVFARDLRGAPRISKNLPCQPTGFQPQDASCTTLLE